jgi:hypothetical protein
MTSAERVDAAFRHQEPDRTPVFEYVLLPPLASVLLGRPMAEYMADGAAWQQLARDIGFEAAVRRYACDRLDLALRLGHDVMYVTPNPDPPRDSPPAPQAPLEPGGGGLAPDDPIERVRVRTLLRRESLAPPAEDAFLVYHHLTEEMDRRGVRLPVLAPDYAHGIWTDTDLMEAMALAPEVAHDHFALATEVALRQLDAYRQCDAITLIGVGGDFAGNRPLISPAAYRTFIVPEVRTVSRAAHAAGLRTINASDGDLWPVIADFLCGCEVDGYLEIDLHAGMDLRRLKDAYGERITFLGNMDCGNTLSFATPEEVAAATRRCPQDGLGRGGHIFCASNAITESVPLANYLAMANAYRSFFDLEPLAL